MNARDRGLARSPATGASMRALPDAPSRNLVDRFAPAAWRPRLRLARFDRPIGAWLLLFPCWWGQGLAELALGRAFPDPRYLALFLIGAFVMRGAGCVYNDIIDRDFDARVARTAGRPIASGEVSVREAWAWLLALCLVGLLVLAAFNAFTIGLGVLSLGLVAVYPFAKRYTFWPQVVLGLTFKWGALLGWAAVAGSLSWAALALYAGSVLWTVGYDTIYAHQDKSDDLALGLKSSALRLGAQTPAWLAGFYAGAILLWACAGTLAGAKLVFLLALAAAGLQMAWQVVTLDVSDAENCLARFRSNQRVGWIVFLGIVAEMARRF